MSENRIIIAGIGNGCNNAINDLIDSNIYGAEYISINRDTYVLNLSKAERKIQIGKDISGRGEEHRPEIGKKFALENKDEIAKAIQNADMLIIVACMGGGIGTGAACAVAEIAKEAGVFTIALVTKPFYFEAQQKRITAENGIDELKSLVESVIVISDNSLLAGTKEPIPAREAFLLSDVMITEAVKSLVEPLSEERLISLDLNDIKITLENTGTAHLVLSHHTGKNKDYKSVIDVITSPLFEIPLSKAGRLLINIVISEDSLASEIDYVTKFISDSARQDVNMIFSVNLDENLHDEIRVCVIAADFR